VFSVGDTSRGLLHTGTHPHANLAWKAFACRIEL